MPSVMLAALIAAAPALPTPPTPPIAPVKPVATTVASVEPGTPAHTSDAGAELPAKKTTVAVEPKEAPAASEKPPGIPPPSISAGALCSELRQAGADRKGQLKKLEDERHALAAERAKLEAATAEISRAREKLRVETAHLEQLLGLAGDASASPAAPPGVASTKQATDRATSLAAVAKTMKSMKPEQAGALVGHLEPRLAAQMIQRMSAKDAAAVLATLKPELAAELTSMLASMPAPSEPKGRKP